MLFLLLAQLCIVPTLSLAQSSGPADACKKMNGTDFSAEDKGVEVPSRTADDCCEICSLDPKCQVGVFTVATGVCALMTSFKTNGVKKAGVVSYIYPPPAPILPVGTMDLSKYTVTWDQDFSKITNLSVSPHGEWPSTWISHTPSYKDWNDFQEQEYDTNGKMVPYHPFNLGDGKLTIRAQQQTDSKGNLLPGKYWGGLLCSVDTKGNGFAQKYGYFEWKAKLPKGPGTWPAFWLLDRPSLVNGSINAHELDIVEQYGDGPGVLHVTLHNWYHTKAYGYGVDEQACKMTDDFHTYGFDMQDDYLTFYFDRQKIAQFPNDGTYGGEKYDREMFVLIDLAYGGGGAASNNISHLIGHPADLEVEYVRVWQGSGSLPLPFFPSLLLPFFDSLPPSLPRTSVCAIYTHFGWSRFGRQHSAFNHCSRVAGDSFVYSIRLCVVRRSTDPDQRSNLQVRDDGQLGSLGQRGQ